MVRALASSSIVTVTVSPVSALAPSRVALFNIMKWLPEPSGKMDERNANRLTVPLTATRALLPNSCSTLNGTLIQAQWALPIGTILALKLLGISFSG
jgi:hypothetical protein